ncbi:MAG: DNA polymerase III subunit chi, partial [Halocynthiibacter sp.]
TTIDNIPNKASCLMSVGGADIRADDMTGLDRAMILFDGFDPDAVAHARLQWKAVIGAKIPAQYWAQEDGRWVKKAEG